MDKSDYFRLADYIKESSSQAVSAIMLVYDYGFRVHEIGCKLKVKNIDFENMKIDVFGKGGRKRVLDINETTLPLLYEITKDKAPNDFVIDIKPDSINKFLNRKLCELNLKSKYKDVGIHSLRKLSAENKYFEYLSQGLNKVQAAGKTSEWLGHSANRSDIIRIYLGRVLNI